MVKFIELTEDDSQPIIFNVANIIWVRPFNDDNGSLIYVNTPGQNGNPVSVYVKEGYSQVKKLIHEL
jgi:hypothetical protein